MKLRDLRARKAGIINAMQAVIDASEDGSFTEEQQARIDSLKAELEQTNKAITLAEDLEKEILSQAGTGTRTPGNGTEAIGPVRPAFVDDPARGFKTPGEFFALVMDATTRGRAEDERLRFLAAAGSDEHGAYADPYGGFLVPSAFSPNMLSLQAESDPTAGRTTAIPMSAPQVQIPARTDKDHTSSVSGGLRVYRRSETQTVTSSRTATELVTLNATELMGITYATDKILRESAVSLVAMLEAGFRAEFGAKVLQEKLRGTGVGQMEGVLNTPSLISIAKEAGQAADSIVAENIIKMRAQCWGYNNAVWLYNHDCLPQLMTMYLSIGTAGSPVSTVPIWQTGGGEGSVDTILGRPAIASEYCSSVGDVGDIILGNWSQYLEATRRGVEMAESMHVRFEYAEQAFRFLMENDGRVWWRSALTPNKSAKTLSPFVTLAAR